MPAFSEFSLDSYSDGVVTINLQNPTSISGWDILFEQYKYKGGSPLFQKFLSSGYVGVSGISLVDGSKGIFTVSLFASDVSGLDPGCYFYSAYRATSGFKTVVAEGFRIMG